MAASGQERLEYLDEGGFVVPHTLPRSSWHVDPVTYTWCHGPAGTSHLSAALAHAGVDTVAGLQVTRLRRKIEADPREPRFLHTVRGRGYVLKPGV